MPKIPFENHKNIKKIDFNLMLTKEKEMAIKNVPYFKESMYSVLKIAPTLEYYYKRYVTQLKDFIEISEKTVIADVGAGYGWLAMVFALATDAKIIAVEIDELRLKAGEKIAKILDIADRIDWRVGGLGKLPMENREADVVYCIEVLEHVYRRPGTLENLEQTSKDLLIITTPNLWFPVIAHDTQLPFCHWLPVSWRKEYARLFGRDKSENDNLFWSPLAIRRKLPEYQPVSNWLHHSSYQKYLELFPYYLPYGHGGAMVNGPRRLKKIYYDIVSKLGKISHYFVPSISYVLKKKLIKN